MIDAAEYGCLIWHLSVMVYHPAQQSRVESATAFLGLEQPMEPPILLEVDLK